MVGKLIDFLGTIAVAGIFALIVTAILCIVLGCLFGLALLPVSIICGDVVAMKVRHFVEAFVSFRLLYAIVFVGMLLEEFGVTGMRAKFRKWRASRKKGNGK